MSPGIGLMKRRLEKEKDAIVLAVSEIAFPIPLEPPRTIALVMLFSKYYLMIKFL